MRLKKPRCLCCSVSIILVADDWRYKGRHRCLRPAAEMRKNRRNFDQNDEKSAFFEILDYGFATRKES
jgi:hypothetical protein